MSIRLLIFLTISIMLKTTIAYLQDIEKDFNRREALVRTIINADKQAKTDERIRFLLECRRASVLPRFISNSVKNISYVFKHSAVVETHRYNFCRRLLNESIKDAFRTKAFRLRESRRLHQETAHHHLHHEVLNLAHEVYEDSRLLSAATLSKKFIRLCRESNVEATANPGDYTGTRRDVSAPDDHVEGPYHREGSEEVNEQVVSRHQRSGNHPAAEVCEAPALQRHNDETSGVASRRHQDTPDDGDAADDLMTASHPEIPGASATSHRSRSDKASDDPFVNRERFLNLTDKTLSEPLVNLLNKGPNFALSRSVNKHVMKDVEIGLERGAFAIRWKESIDRAKANHRTPTSSPDDPPNANDTPQAARPSLDDAPTTQRKVTLTPRFSDTDSKAAPTAGAHTEQALRTVKQKVMTLFRNHKTVAQPNHQSSDVNLLKELSKDPEIVIKRSDKCKGLVVLSKTEYVEKASAITDTYEAVGRNPTPKLEAETKRIIRTTLTGKVPDKIVKSVMPSGSRTAELYGLPKTHKPNTPLRPIVSACGDPLDKLTWLLERVTTQLLAFVPAHLKNTEDYLHRLKSQFDSKFPDGTIVFSVDVTNLYGNIPTGQRP